MTDSTGIAVAAVFYVAGRTGGQLPAELTGLPHDQIRRILNAAARLVFAIEQQPHRPQHAAEPLD
jgi:hypothetical protein